MASTPFSINDILTKNNTTLYRRRISSGELSPMSRSNGNLSDTDYHSSEELSHKLTKSMKLFKHPPMDQFHLKNQYDRHIYTKLEREHALRHSPDTPPHDNDLEDKLSPIYKKYQASTEPNRNGSNDYKDYRMQKEFGKRRGSLDCFLIDANHNNTDRDNISNGGTMERKTTASATDHQMKIGYYNYPLPVESPLDMRRCANDSG